MSDITAFIKGSEKLTNIFGDWPSFHDAEVIELHFWRGDVDPEANRYVFPVLTLKLLVFELIQERDGTFASRNHTLTTLRFHDVAEDFSMEGFNHENMIFGLEITTQERGKFTTGEDLPPYLVVQFEQGFGIKASFKCFRVEVLDTIPCTEDGKPIS